MCPEMHDRKSNHFHHNAQACFFGALDTRFVAIITRRLKLYRGTEPDREEQCLQLFAATRIRKKNGQELLCEVVSTTDDWDPVFPGVQ